MTRFSDAALLKGDYAHMAAEFRTGARPAPKRKDWRQAACDNQAEEVAQELAKHIFSLQKQLDHTTERLEILHETAVGPMRVLAVVPGDGDVLRLDGVMDNGDPVAQALHTSQLSLTFVKAAVHSDDDEDDSLKIGFLIFDDLTSKRRKRERKLLKRSMAPSQKENLYKPPKTPGPAGPTRAKTKKAVVK